MGFFNGIKEFYWNKARGAPSDLACTSHALCELCAPQLALIYLKNIPEDNRFIDGTLKVAHCEAFGIGRSNIITLCDLRK
jgi:tRNA isopentenyl-2-thiomethyl-A-37 hydroxylase MiaE